MMVSELELNFEDPEGDLLVRDLKIEVEQLSDRGVINHLLGTNKKGHPVESNDRHHPVKTNKKIFLSELI